MKNPLLVILAAATLAGNAAAQSPVDYPNRAVRTIVPYTPGTGPDLLARTIGARLSERWKQGLVATYAGPDELAGILRRELDRWGKVVRDAKIKAD